MTMIQCLVLGKVGHWQVTTVVIAQGQLKNLLLPLLILLVLLFIVNSFFEMERCNFTRNRGIGSSTDLGSAFAAWLVRDFRATAPLPKYHMTDW